MRFLANENFPAPSIGILKHAGYDILNIAELSSGISDHEVIDMAVQGNRIILTFDSDYGEIIFKHRRENPPAVIFFRFKGDNPEEAGKRLIDLLSDKKLQVDKTFTVVERDNVRQRRY